MVSLHKRSLTGADPVHTRYFEGSCGQRCYIRFLEIARGDSYIDQRVRFVHATFVHASRRLRLRGERLLEVCTDVRAPKAHSHGFGRLVADRIQTAKPPSLLRYELHGSEEIWTE